MKAVKISKNEMNYLKDDGSYLLNKSVELCWDFMEGFGAVEYVKGVSNYINSECKHLLKTNVNYCFSFNEDGFALVIINEDWYRIDKEGNFYNGYKVSFKELYNLYPNKRSKLIEIIDKYTYHNVDEYFV